MVEVQRERQRVVEVIASMSGGAVGSQKTGEELSEHGTDSDKDSEQSMRSEERPPVVTPGTSDEII